MWGRIFYNIDITLLKENLYGFTVINIFSSLLTEVESCAFFIPLIYGFFIAFINTKNQRIKIIGFLVMPLLFFVVFVTGGGLFFFVKTLGKLFDDKFLNMLIGAWCSQLILTIIWFFYDIKLKIHYFIVIAILVLPPYFLGLNGTQEFDNSIFIFYFLYNSGISICLSWIFAQKK